MANPLYDQLFAIHKEKTTPFLHLLNGTTLSHQQFLALAAQIANVTNQLGLKPGDRVAAQVEKSHQALALYAACVQAGLVYLPLNTAYTANELHYFIENSGASLIVCDSGRSQELLALSNELGATLETLNTDGTGTLMERADTMPRIFETVERASDDLAALLYTSGTTGRSKGAMLTQSNLLSNSVTLAREWQFDDSDVLIHALPLFHTHGLFVAVNVSLVAGSSIIFLPKFDVELFVENIPRSTVMMGVPTFYTRLIDDDRIDKGLTRNMRLFVSGSAPLLAETHTKFEERTEHKILERYGMTETNMNTSNPYDGERRAGTVGFPLPHVEVRIIDPATDECLADGQVGQIEVRGPNVFKGYWQMPEKTAAELRDDGFFITGDLGRFDEDGYLHIVGRAKDLIISGGYNVYPKEVELLLDEVDGVDESAVIGVPHPDFGEGVIGVLVPKRGKVLDESSVLTEINSKIARFKQPKKLFIVNKLPRNTMGKVQKNLLREQYESVFN